jgi:integrase/recombinase XerD
VTISEAFELYRLDVIMFKNQSSKTEENHVICMRALVRFFGDCNIEDLTFADIRKWKQHLDKQRSPATVRNYIIKLRVVLVYLKARGLRVVDPETIAVPKRTDSVPNCITPEEVDLLIKAVSMRIPGLTSRQRMRNRAIVSFLYASGLRVSELVALDRSDLTTDQFTVVGKGGRVRPCFIDARTRLYLTRYFTLRADNNPALFISDQTGMRISVGTVQEIFKLGWKKAGFEKPVHPHTLRHSFATNLMRNGMHIYSVSRIMGHRSIDTTAQYLHVADPILKEDYTKHHTI